MVSGMPYIEPRVVDVGDKDHVVSFDVGHLLERKLNYDANFRNSCISKSDEWKAGEKWKTSPSGEIKDLDDGLVARMHPHLMRPATDAESEDLRIALIMNADDVEVCNPLGTARGEHKECGIQAAVANLGIDERFKMDNILLVGLAKAKVYKVHGMA